MILWASNLAYFTYYEDYGPWCGSMLTCFIKSFDMTYKFPEGGIGAGLTSLGA